MLHSFMTTANILEHVAVIDFLIAILSRLKVRFAKLTAKLSAVLSVFFTFNYLFYQNSMFIVCLRNLSCVLMMMKV